VGLFRSIDGPTLSHRATGTKRLEARTVLDDHEDEAAN
jgi:hypothetical protein